MRPWLDPFGEPMAFAERSGGRFRVHVPGVASFEFGSTRGAVDVHLENEGAEQLAEEYFFRTILPLVVQARGREVLHASAVATAAGVIALGAPKESGKSTLAFALSRRGRALWADDAVALELRADRVWALALPFDLRLRPAPAALFGGRRIVPVSRDREAARQPVEWPLSPLLAVVLLERFDSASESAEVTLARVVGGDALASLLRNAYCCDPEDEERRRRMTGHYLELAARVPIYRLRFPTGLERLPRTVARLEELLRELETGQ